MCLQGGTEDRVHLVLVAQNEAFAFSFPPESARVSPGHAIIKRDERKAASDGTLAPCALPPRAARFAVVRWLSVAWYRDQGMVAGNTGLVREPGGWEGRRRSKA